jgi:hypothetical protein
MNDHEMQLTVRPTPWYCDGCHTKFTTGTPSYFCHLCVGTVWDACESCVQHVCSKGHFLERAIREEFRCDKCFKNSVGDSVGCQTCDYTVCSFCRFGTTAPVSRYQLDGEIERVEHSLCQFERPCCQFAPDAARDSDVPH